VAVITFLASPNRSSSPIASCPRRSASTCMQ
jgi:hypothetical protein